MAEIETKIEEMKQYLLINKNSLDEECQEQPLLFYKIAEEVVSAISKRDACKELLQETDAVLAKKYRDEADTNNVKITEAKILQAVQIDETHKKVFLNYSNKKQKVDELEALKNAFLQRATMLKTLCDLYVAGYFSTDSVKIKVASKGNFDYENRKRDISKKRLEG